MRKLAMMTAGFVLITFSAARADDLAGSAGQATSRDAATTAQAGFSGDYKRLDLWEKVKLGSAVFTNPKAVRNAKFAYSFDPSSFDKPEAKEKILWLAKEGKLGFGIPEKGSGTLKVLSLAGLGEYSGKGEIHNASELSTILANVGGQVVSDKDWLLGSEANGSLIKSSAFEAPEF